LGVNEKNRLHVLLAFGGRSDEHNVSLISASNIISHFNPEKYKLKLLYITKQGNWILCRKSGFKLHCDFPDQILSTITGVPVYLPIGRGKVSHIFTEDTEKPIKIDLVFPVLHGRNGAGGILPGLWETAGIPFAGPSLTGGAVGFDKDIMKRLLSEAGLPVCRYSVIHQNEYTPSCLDKLVKLFGLPFFIKPGNSGSSLGVHKIYKEADFADAVKDVFSYDNKLIVEEYIDGSELEVYCFASGDEIKTSIIRQTIVGPEYEFYTYEAKYGIDNGTANIKNIPADIPEKDYKKVKDLAVQAYKTLEGRGEVRFDLFYSNDGQIYINEINTVPALMTEQSQPSLWYESGISQEKIIDDMIFSALQK